MMPLIRPAKYCDPEVLSEEITRLFDRSWQFAGFTSDAPRHQDYFCTTVAGRSIVIQNFNGVLRAFHNVCSHRFNRIRAEARGCGPLQCGYHGWVFDHEGRPAGITQIQDFDGMTEECRKTLYLDAWQLETCGQLVFIRHEASGPGLRETFGAFYDGLEAMGNALGERILEKTTRIKANWKVVVENTLESYHVRWVHPDTFFKLGANGGDFAFDQSNSQWSVALSESAGRRFQSFARKISSIPCSREGYMHLFGFPNFAIASTCGINFGLQKIQPIGIGETEFTSYVFQSSYDVTVPVQQIMMDTMRPPGIEFAKLLFDEDKGICEQVQLGLAEAGSRPGIFGAEECRVYAFQEAYVSAIKAN